MFAINRVVADVKDVSLGQGDDAPFFSICIPQYNRVLHLLEAIRSLSTQSFKSFEICISDDCSPDRGEERTLELCARLGLRCRYRRQSVNVKYDGNVRAAIEMATGKYCLLHGNDDCLKSTEALQKIHHLIVEHGFPKVVIPNYEDWKSGKVTRRVHSTGITGSGPAVAMTSFRNVSFVTGVIFDRVEAQRWSTSKWDGSEMYQMFLASRLVAAGGAVLAIEESLVRKDIHIEGEEVDSYRISAGADDFKVRERHLPMIMIARVVSDAILPYVSAQRQSDAVETISRQLYTYTYPFWLVEYRRVRSWRFACGLALGMRPRNVLFALPLRRGAMIRLCAWYVAMVAGGLLLPICVFDRIRPIAFHVAKRTQRAAASGKCLVANRPCQ